MTRLVPIYEEPAPGPYPAPHPGKKRGGRPRVEHPSRVDVHVGARVKQRRIVLGMSQSKLASELGITFQQVQKYERGTNRIGASRLHDMARVLSAPPAYFFDEMPDTDAGQSAMADDVYTKRETLEMVRAYWKIPDQQRAALFALMKKMGAVES